MSNAPDFAANGRRGVGIACFDGDRSDGDRSEGDGHAAARPGCRRPYRCDAPQPVARAGKVRLRGRCAQSDPSSVRDMMPAVVPSS